MFSTDIKVRNRLSMKDEIVNENKNNNKIKEEEVEEEKAEEKKRNVKKKVKINRSDIKKAKKKVKYPKRVVVIQEQEDDN